MDSRIPSLPNKAAPPRLYPRSLASNIANGTKQGQKRKAAGLQFSYTISQDETTDQKKRQKLICLIALGRRNVCSTGIHPRRQIKKDSYGLRDSSISGEIEEGKRKGSSNLPFTRDVTRISRFQIGEQVEFKAVDLGDGLIIQDGLPLWIRSVREDERGSMEYQLEEYGSEESYEGDRWFPESALNSSTMYDD